MQQQNASVYDTLVKAFEESKSETIDLVVEHELRGVTPEMIAWWGASSMNSERYRLWYPEDHISFEWEVPPTESQRASAIQIAEEKIGEFPASKLRIRYEDLSSSPIPTTYNYAKAGSILGPSDKPITRTVHEYEAAPYGTRMRSTFRLPAKTPQRFIDALRKHNQDEEGRLCEFLPELYKQNVG